MSGFRDPFRSVPRWITAEPAPLIATTVIAVVFVGYVLNALLYVILDGASPLGVLGACAVLVALLALQLGVISNPAVPARSVRSLFAVTAQAVLVLAPVAAFGSAWLGMPGFLAGSALLVVRGRWRWTVVGTVCLVAGSLMAHYTRGDPAATVYVTIVTLLTGLIVFGLSRLRELVLTVQLARSDLAQLAVAEERLWLARDMHELLHDRLSMVTLKCELALRLVGYPVRARAELSAVLALSRRATADTRAAAHGYRGRSLRDELAAARSMLTAGHIDVTIDDEDREVAPDVGAALAAALRVGVDNLLLHSWPRSCTLRVSRSMTAVRLEILNDGAPCSEPARSPAGGSLDQLAVQVQAAGGSLVAGRHGTAGYRLCVELPSGAPVTDPPAGSGPHRRAVLAGDAAGLIQPGVARTIVIAVLVGYTLTAILLALQQVSGTVAVVVSVLSLAGVLALQLGYLSRDGAPRRRRTLLAALVAQAVLVFGPVVAFEAPEASLPGFVAGSALLLFGPVRGAVVFVAVVVAVAVAQFAYLGALVGVAYGILSTVNHGLVVFGLTRLRSLVTGLHRARSDLARLAVVQERLRFARDVHDLLGYSFSAITLKTELADRLLEVHADLARTELHEVLDVARRALADVRLVSGSHRELALDDELSAVTSVLASAGIRVDLCDDRPALSPALATVIATVLRESVTNVLRHSYARYCVISLRARPDAVLLVVENDGIHLAPGTSGGSGVVNMTARVQAVAGVLEAGPVPGGRYRLCAEIPLVPVGV